MKHFSIFSLLMCLLLFLSACQTSGLNSDSIATTVKAPVRAIPVDVPAQYISQQDLATQLTPIGNLFGNPGFEQGLNEWTACEAGGIKLSSDAYEGSNALEVINGNCFYKSVGVSPGQEYNLSCYVKILSGSQWTGMGLAFADNSWNTIGESQATVITGTDYARYDVKATAPANTTYASMWLYSDNNAVVDNCSLMPEWSPPPPPPPPPSAGNLLENGNFVDLSNWATGCSGVVGTETSGGVSLSNGACIDQSLSASDIAELQGQDYTYSCSVKNTGGYASMSIFLDGQPKSVEIPNNLIFETIELKGIAGNTISSGFVSLYGEGNALKVLSCSLTVDGDEPPPPPSGDNLLENGGFESSITGNWVIGCNDRRWNRVIDPSGALTGEAFLSIAGGACADQSFDTSALAGKNYSYSCYVKSNLGGSNASLTIFFDDTPISKQVFVEDDYQLIEISGTAPNASSGFVSLYTDGSISVDDCQLEIDSTDPPQPTGTPSIDVRNNLEGSDTYALSGPYTFEVAVRNNGDVPFTNVTLASDVLDCDANFVNLVVGEVKIISCASTVIATPTQGFSHTVTATATTDDGRVVIDSDQSGYRPALRASPRAILKMVTNNRIVAADSDVKFLVSVANTGNVSGISEIESNVADCVKQFTPALSSGDIEIYECVATNVQESFIATVNVVMVGAYRTSAQDSINIAIENSVAVDISVGTEGAEAYGIFSDENPHSFEVTVRNIGGTDFSSVELVSDSVTTCSKTITNLAMGETTNYTCASPLLTTGQLLKNSVTATAQSAEGIQGTDEDSSTIYPQGDLSLDISLGEEGTDEITIASGTDIDVIWTVRNTGKVDINQIWEAFMYSTTAPGFQPICQDLTPYANPNETDRVPFNLAAGETKSFTCPIENVTQSMRLQATFAHLNDRSGQKRDTDILVVRVLN